ncbi:MAG: acetylornithine transaminase [Planctomycetota bacterium]
MDEHVVRTYVREPEVFVSGQGATLFTEDGRRFLDFLGGIAVSALGHHHPRLTHALHDQVDRVLHTSNLYRHPFTEELAGHLAKASGLEAVFFANSGAEANECTLKIARKYQEVRGEGDRDHFLALDGCFHGRTLGALSVTSGAAYRKPFAPLLESHFLPRNDIAALEKAIETRPAGLILEPIQGEGGIHELDHGFLRRARELCTESNTVLIHDEVQSGTGRTGKFLAGDHASVKPDLATLAKPLAGGLPIGCCLTAKGFESILQPGDHGSTFAGGPLVSRAAIVVMEELQDGLLDAVAERGAQLRAGLEAFVDRYPRAIEVRGRGLMLGLQIDGGAQDLQRWLYENGLITHCTQKDVLRLLPPYVVTDGDIEEALVLIDRGLAQTADAETLV